MEEEEGKIEDTNDAFDVNLKYGPNFVVKAREPRSSSESSEHEIVPVTPPRFEEEEREVEEFEANLSARKSLSKSHEEDSASAPKSPIKKVSDQAKQRELKREKSVVLKYVAFPDRQRMLAMQSRHWAQEEYVARTPLDRFGTPPPHQLQRNVSNRSVKSQSQNPSADGSRKISGGSTAAGMPQVSPQFGGLRHTPFGLPSNLEYDDAESPISQMMSMIIDASVDPVVVSDEEGNILTFNRAFQELLGYERWELVGQNITILMDPETANHHEEYVQRYLNSHIKRVVDEWKELEVKRKDGEMIEVLRRVYDHFDGFNHVFAAVFRDMRWQKQLKKLSDLVGKMLPKDVTDRLLNNEDTVAESYMCSVGFIDLVGYTAKTQHLKPHSLVNLLTEMFAMFDIYLEKHRVKRLKTIGDCYMFVTNLRHEISAHAVNAVMFAFDCLNSMKKRNSSIEPQYRFPLRIGIATGEVIAGVVSGSTVAYDIWGPTVNLASRLESKSQSNRILVCESECESSFSALVNTPRGNF